MRGTLRLAEFSLDAVVQRRLGPPANVQHPARQIVEAVLAQHDQIDPRSARAIAPVDDEPLVCDAIKMMLNFDGHIVETANSARAALELFDNAQFDLVITDF